MTPATSSPTERPGRRAPSSSAPGDRKRAAVALGGRPNVLPPSVVRLYRAIALSQSVLGPDGRRVPVELGSSGAREPDALDSVVGYG